MANAIQDKLAYLEETKGLIKEAIIAKGVSVSDEDTFRSYANKIKTIQSGGSLAGAPSGIRFNNSTFTTVPTEIIPYLEQQTDLNGMFMNCSSLETVPAFDTSKCTDTSNMFNSCYSLKTVPLFETSSVVDMHYMFSYCQALKTVPSFNTSNVTTMNGMFGGCASLQTVSLFDVNKVDNMGSIFWSCNELSNLGGFTDLKLSLNLSDCPKLTIESIVNVVNAAADMTSNPQTLTLNKDAFNRLSEEQIATASAKGWNIASA